MRRYVSDYWLRKSSLFSCCPRDVLAEAMALPALNHLDEIIFGCLTKIYLTAKQSRYAATKLSRYSEPYHGRLNLERPWLYRASVKKLGIDVVYERTLLAKQVVVPHEISWLRQSDLLFMTAEDRTGHTGLLYRLLLVADKCSHYIIVIETFNNTAACISRPIIITAELAYYMLMWVTL